MRPRSSLVTEFTFFAGEIPAFLSTNKSRRAGNNARIAANSVVLREVPDNATVVGVPGRVVRLCGEKLDHIHTPDPVQLELDQVKNRLATLEHAMRQLERRTNAREEYEKPMQAY